MPKSARRSAAVRDSLSPQVAARLRSARRWAVHAVAAIAFIGCIAMAVARLQLSIAAESTGQAPHIVFAHRPSWMSDVLATALADSFRPDRPLSVFDRKALLDVHDRLRNNAWVGKIGHVQRLYGQAAGDTIEIDCEFRMPAALVNDHQGHYWFVDEKGVKLPEWFDREELSQLTTTDGRVTMRLIEGVRNRPPTEAGQLWPGDDLIAGLDLAQAIAPHPFAQDVVAVDVSNYGGRRDLREAQIVLKTKYDTQILWGRPINAVDAFVEGWPAQKLTVLGRLYRDYRRADTGAAWVDIRFPESVAVPGPASAATQDGGHASGAP